MANPVTVGPFIITGTDAQVVKIAQMAKRVGDVLGSRIKNVNVGFYPSNQMPKRADGGASVGYTPNGHKIMLWDSLIHHVPETFAHEACHALDGQWFTNQQRHDLMALEAPTPSRWQSHDYTHEGCENFACYGSGALFAITPAWQRFYLSPIAPSAWPQLAGLALKDYGAAEPPPGPVVLPDPTPAEPPDLQAQIDALTAQSAQLLGALQTCQRDRDDGLARIAKKDAALRLAQSAGQAANEAATGGLSA